MNYFCLLWVPLFYLLRRAFIGEGGSAGIWAVLFGSITAILQFFLGNFISPGGFGFSRWLFGFVDIVSVPVLIPLVIYLLSQVLRGFSGEAGFANFAMLWLIPIGAFRTLSWSATNDPILLVITPLLWTALAAGIPFFINLMVNNFRWYTAVISITGILILPVLAAAVYTVFFSQQTPLGIALLVAANIPLILSLVFDILRRR